MPRHHGKLKDGTAITDEMVEKMADEAEGGYDVDEIERRRTGGRPRWVRVRPASSPFGLILS